MCNGLAAAAWLLVRANMAQRQRLQVRYGGSLPQPKATVRCQQPELGQLLVAALPDILSS